MKFFVSWLIIFFLFVPDAVASEQLFSGVAVNNKTNQCQREFLGEYARLKPEWKFYPSDPDYISWSLGGENPYESCRQRKNTGDCCQELGYTYVDTDIIDLAPYVPVPTESNKTDRSLLINIAIMVVIIVATVYYFVRKKLKTVNHNALLGGPPTT